MARFSAIHATKVLAAAAVIALAGAASGQAGDRDGRHHYRHKPHGKHYVPTLNRLEGGLAVRQRSMHDTASRRTPDGDFYGGRIFAYDDTGSGVYFVRTGNRIAARAREARPERKTVQIIDLTQGRNDCSMEAGVCVIRP